MPAEPPRTKYDDGRLALLQALQDEGYAFSAPAPSTHRRVLAGRLLSPASTLQDLFGWSLPFAPDGPLAPWTQRLEQAGALVRQGRMARSTLRVASLGPQLFFHSAFPPRDPDTVFLGPDSYRFANLIRGQVCRTEAPSVLDIGSGAGVGGIVAGALWSGARIVLADVNAKALDLARVNAAFAGLSPRLETCDGLPPGRESFDIILANPPYIGAGPVRTYSDGGGALGAAITLDWTRQALTRLNPQGQFILYSGAAILRGGRDSLRPALAALAADQGCALDYVELDPDVFPATLLHRTYWGVERIAAIGAVFARPPNDRNSPPVQA